MTRVALLTVLLAVPFTVASAASLLRCPSYCECYSTRTQEVVDCSSKMLAALPSVLPTNVTTLRLGFNNLTQLRNSTLEGRGLSYLERLELNDNLLAVIEPGAFSVVPRLTRLDLGNNLIRLIHPDTFHPLTRLWKLVLNGNPLELPEDGPFFVAPELQVLELERCGIHHLNPTAFQNLTGLLILRLTGNALTTVSLRGDRLIHAAIGSNQLNEETLQLNSPNLLVLDLSDSGLTRLPGHVLRSTPSLQRLKLELNSLRNLDAEILAAIPQLKVLDLSRNQITTLHTNVFQNNSNLTQLDLSANPLQPIDDGFIYSSSLQILSLAACNLSRVTVETFRGMPNITHLILSDNSLVTLSKVAFSVLPNLQSLSVDGNIIFTVFSGFTSGLVNLEFLNLNRNPLHIPTDEPFLESNSLKELLINQCGLETLPVTMLRLLPNLTTFRVSNNELTTLDVQTVQIVPELTVVDIDGNPLTCNCSLLPLWQWCSTRQCENSIVRCRRPRGRTWSVLADLVCNEGTDQVLEDFDIDLEVELVNIPAPSRRPPERLTV